MHESVSGLLQVSFLRMTVAQSYQLRKEGEGKAGASRRGKTLLALTAIGMALSHASSCVSFTQGGLLSNTLLIYPAVGDNHGKLWIIPLR